MFTSPAEVSAVAGPAGAPGKQVGALRGDQKKPEAKGANPYAGKKG
jgi:hypothetical protein